MDITGGHLLTTNLLGPKNLDSLAEEAYYFGIAANRRKGTPFADCLAAETLEIRTDGVINIDGMLNWCVQTIKAGGAIVQLKTEANAISPTEGGYVVETNNGTIKTRTLINAAGGWAQSIGSMAAGIPIPFKPTRRHLVWSATAYPKDRPWTWWNDKPFYMRPESGGLLMSPMDEVEVIQPKLNSQPATDTSVMEDMAEIIREVAPPIADYPINRLWCGIRTFSPDRKFVIGRDPINPRLFWVSGLGGHGMTSGLAVGRLAAKLLIDGGSAGELDPRRLCPSSKKS
jgi:glycine/D-amino acid oxidase-like deaminating enzyme